MNIHEDYPGGSAPAVAWAGRAAIFTAAALAIGGCTLQSGYVPPDMNGPNAWSEASALQVKREPAAEDGWWRALGDPAVDMLIESALADSPTLSQAVARMDEARATLGVNSAAAAPTITASGSATRAKSQNTVGPATTLISNSAAIGPALSWEVDLFGRIRNSVDAVRNRLDARTADAAAARLSLAADVANGVLSLRACDNSRAVLADDIAARERSLGLTRLRATSGFAPPSDVARAVSGIATVRTNLASQQEQCARQVNALVALSGKDASAVRQQVLGAATTPAFMPQPPASAPELPATVLARHPSVIASNGEAAAAWAEIGVARADRLPRLDLAAVLTGQWIRAAGSTLNFTTWSIGPSLTGTLFDGGAGAANVSAAEARYRQSVASLRGTLRTTVEDVENALAAQTSAQDRAASAHEATDAAHTTLVAAEGQWKAGAISLFELEDSRRQYASAQDAEISARRDRAQAWVALVKATGGAVTLTTEPTAHE
ncbi:efflux transporter outer membrane subunit [Ralstonia nicotianae]|uniref:efflux transporter outer membrane subunit n=1 Tax=Ralstonia pseudosolanacearum TaxID=1310165 RepID=UPI00249E4D25|nr:efflux transporter outer membrane subunit [Ralstonia pseudosolanacearum]MCK4120442.1 efflux transporter outer membrane subunit [Ralstonia pseudosolanacearum]